MTAANLDDRATRALEHEIVRPGPLLDEDGRLREPGWTRQPLLEFDPARTGGTLLRALRLKQWDYYGIWTPELFVAASIAHVGYVGMGFVYVVDLATGRNPERTVLTPFGRGIAMPTDSRRGDLRFSRGGLSIELVLAPGERRIRARDDAFDRGAGLEIDASLACPDDHESVVTATPFTSGGFFYNRKLNVLRASGTLRWGSARTELRPDTCLGQLDWGRGVWPYRSHWVWSSANGFLPDGRTVGLNLGFFGDHGAAAENALVLEGRVHKLGRLRADFDSQNYLAPWRFRDETGRLDVTLEPTTERIARTDLAVLRTEVHQCFGRFRGRVRADDGSEITLAELPGFAEEHHARW